MRYLDIGYFVEVMLWVLGVIDEKFGVLGVRIRRRVFRDK